MTGRYDDHRHRFFFFRFFFIWVVHVKCIPNGYCEKKMKKNIFFFAYIFHQQQTHSKQIQWKNNDKMAVVISRYVCMLEE